MQIIRNHRPWQNERINIKIGLSTREARADELILNDQVTYCGYLENNMLLGKLNTKLRT